MRTTVTLDPDVEQRLREAMRQTGQSFKQTLNQAVRRGLVGVVAEADEPPFIVKPKAMGVRPGIDPTRLHELADDLEVAAFQAVTRQLEQQAKNRAGS